MNSTYCGISNFFLPQIQLCCHSFLYHVTNSAFFVKSLKVLFDAVCTENTFCVGLKLVLGEVLSGSSDQTSSWREIVSVSVK